MLYQIYFFPRIMIISIFVPFIETEAYKHCYDNIKNIHWRSPTEYTAKMSQTEYKTFAIRHGNNKGYKYVLSDVVVKIEVHRSKI